MIVFLNTSHHDANSSLAFIETIDEDVRLILHVVTLTKLRVLRVICVLRVLAFFKKSTHPRGMKKKPSVIETERRAMKVFLLSAFVVIATASAACGPDGCEGVRLFEMHYQVL